MARRGMGGRNWGRPLANRRAANQPINRGVSPRWNIGAGPVGFKKGGSVKGHGSGLARRKRK